ncbi:MAG: IS1 family transposase [Flavipsychrobacter sp.]
MQQNLPGCVKLVDGQKKCIYCDGICVKNGTTKGKQRYLCKQCNKSFVSCYTYHAYKINTGRKIKCLLREGCGIRSIARLLKIAVGTVWRRILLIAKTISRPLPIMQKEYEVDELCTYLGKKTNLLWVVYAVRRDTKQVADFAVGCRTSKTLRMVTETLVLSNATKVYTDKLLQYRSLLPSAIHRTTQYNTNNIECMNLKLRTHLKRLNRRTICFTKSQAMLSACLKIYFWG